MSQTTPSSPPAAKPVSWTSLLRTVRAPLSVIVLAGIGLSLPPQSRDMLAALGDGSFVLSEAFIFYLSLAFLTFSGWYWARALISARFDVPHTAAGRARLEDADRRLDLFAFDAVPWLIFWLAGLVGVLLIVRSGAWNALWFLAAWAVVFAFFRPTRMKDRQRQPLRYARGGQPTFREVGGGPQRSTASLREWWHNIPTHVRLLANRAPGGPIVAWALILVSAALFLWGAIASFAFVVTAASLPLVLARFFTGPSSALMLLGLIIPLLSLVTFIADGLRIEFNIMGRPTGPSRPPVIALLVALTAITPWLLHLHTVRVIEADLPERKNLSAYFQEWAKACAPKEGPVRPIIVTVSGGASRAAVWGAQVLQDVEEASQPGGPAVFAVSSVSGGSLGVAAYMALLAAMKDDERCAADSRDSRRKQAGLLAEAPLGDDLLSALLAGWLAVDIPRSLLGPFAAVIRVFVGEQPRGGDRAEAIERAFEVMWARPWTDVPRIRLDEPFLSLFYNGKELRPGMPLWISNGTEVTSGSRLLTVPFDSSEWPFRASRDVLALIGADVPISTAINNTARFPYLEPSGELLERKIRKDGSWSLWGRLCDQFRVCAAGATEIIDGGYFENEGLQTALDLAGWLRVKGKEALGGREVWPIIVQATADGAATLTLKHVVRWESPPDDPAEPVRVSPSFQILAPISGLYNVRSGHSAVLLREAKERLQTDFVHFMLPGIGGRDVPLNWVLSRETVSRIREATSKPNDLKNQEERQRMGDLMKPQKP